MKPWSAWLPSLIPSLPGCPDFVAEDAVRKAAQKFFRKTLSWRMVLDPESVSAGDYEIEPEIPAGKDLVRIENVWYDGVELSPTSSEAMFSNSGGGWMAQTGTPQRFIQDVPGTIRLYPIPVSNSQSGIAFRVSVSPGDSSTGLPDGIYGKHKDALLSGAKSILMLTADQPWTNFQLGEKMEADFLTEIDSATSEAAMLFGIGRISSHPNWC